jgi:hypothetical protein
VGEQARREHVQLVVGAPADEIAPAGGLGERALHAQPRLRGGELRGGAVQHDRELTDALREPGVEPAAGVFELGQHALGIRVVARVVARGERVRGGLDPGQDRIVSARRAAGSR